jgi:hypothetical protein
MDGGNAKTAGVESSIKIETRKCEKKRRDRLFNRMLLT